MAIMHKQGKGGKQNSGMESIHRKQLFLHCRNSFTIQFALIAWAVLTIAGCTAGIKGLHPETYREATALNDQGVWHLEQGEFPLAQTAFEKALLYFNPGMEERDTVFMNLALTYLILENPADFVRTMEQAIRERKKGQSVGERLQFYAGLMYYLKNDDRQALQHFNGPAKQLFQSRF